jgi:pimeloyl-ACP methyl ester carboxylesterase
LSTAEDRPFADEAFTRLARSAGCESRWLAEVPRLPGGALLRRFIPRCPSGQGRAVLLVHGASASSRTFLVPDGGLVAYLLERGLDVWTLDWRASSLLSRRLRKAHSARSLQPDVFHLGSAAEGELALALDVIRASGAQQVGVLGHCVGAALVTTGILRDRIGAGVDRVVLTTLGMFCRVGLENWFKGNERVLEGLAAEDFPDGWPAISPWAATGRAEFRWPRQLETMFTLWRAMPARHACDSELCHRVSFMFGMPFNPELVAAMHGASAGEAPRSLEQAGPEHGFWGHFGEMPLGLYVQVSQSLRQGWLPDVDIRRAEGELQQKFAAFDLTLITGHDNQLWHRESLDFMYDWLRRTPERGDRPRVTKHVARGFGHQDLFWCEDALRREGIYARLLEGLGGR